MTCSPIKGICVVGRTDFETGYGRHSLAALELLSHEFNVYFRSSQPESFKNVNLSLTNGREIRLANIDDVFEAYFFCDVPWNGFEDYKEFDFPKEAYKVAHFAWDSDVLPSEWVEIINTHFDMCLFTSEWLIDVALNSGVNTSVAVLPLSLDLSDLLSNPVRNRIETEKIVFGSLSSFHPRKNLEPLVQAFNEEFGEKDNVELHLHSNLEVGKVLENIQLMASQGVNDISISYGKMSENDKNQFIRSLSVYVNVSAGEGYSIGPREAMAAGLPCVLSDIPGHASLIDLHGVVPIISSGKMPAVYPEISNLCFGNQELISVTEIRKALRETYLRYQQLQEEAKSRERWYKMASLDWVSMSSKYAEVFRESISPINSGPLEERVSSNSTNAIFTGAKDFGKFGNSFGSYKLVIPMHDGGYFSIFNTYLTHLVWNQYQRKNTLVVPDWRPAELLKLLEGEVPTSFCYGGLGDGNAWNNIYQPVFGLSSVEMNSEEFLNSGKKLPENRFGEDREPWLTYVHAYNLYRAPWFQMFRRQYNQVLREHIRLLPELQSDIDSRVATLEAGRFRISAHVRHPSHALEQPNGQIAGDNLFIQEIRSILSAKGISEKDNDWEVFLATDNALSVQNFQREFGEKVCFIDEVDRASIEQMNQYNSIDQSELLNEGHQIQHLNASKVDSWSWTKAFEVIRDAELLAASDVVLHTVSNVATAVAIMNPNVEMRLCLPGEK